MDDGIEFAEKITEILLNEVCDIDIILLYGGFAQGRGHSRSDYDILAISDKKEVKWEFIVDEHPICLWSMTWKDVKAIITGKDGRI